MRVIRRCTRGEPPSECAGVAGEAPLGEHRERHGHLGALYSSDVGRTKLAVAFLVDGLRPGTACYLVAAPAARDDILAQLEASTPSLPTEIDAGRLVLSGCAGSARAQYEYFETSFIAATRAGAHSLRVVGDVWPLSESLTRNGLVEYEAGCDRFLAQRFPVVTLCQYDVRRFSSLDVFHALQGHKDTLRYPVERLLSDGGGA